MSRPTATSFDKPPCLTLDTVTLTRGGGGGDRRTFVSASTVLFSVGEIQVLL